MTASSNGGSGEWKFSKVSWLLQLLQAVEVTFEKFTFTNGLGS